MGALDTLRDFGRRYFEAVSAQAYGLVCGNDEQNAKTRGELQQALGDRLTFGTLLASALVSSLGLAPTLAAVVAAIVVKLFFAPAYQTTCTMWGDALKAKPA